MPVMGWNARYRVVSGLTLKSPMAGLSGRSSDSWRVQKNNPHSLRYRIESILLPYGKYCGKTHSMCTYISHGMQSLRNRDTRVQCFLGRSGEGRGYVRCVLHSSPVTTGCISTSGE